MVILDEGRLQCLLSRKVPHTLQLVVAAGTRADVVESSGRCTVVHGPVLYAAPVSTPTTTLFQSMLEFTTELSCVCILGSGRGPG